MNIEQSKLLNTSHLSTLLGDDLYKDLGKQRQWLGQLATDDIIRSVLQTNARHLDLADHTSKSDFYLDPHTKHYTGEKNVLKGWCSGIGRVDKVMHSDFIHNVDGHPVYFETTDNFLDLRERTFDFLQRFRTELEFEEMKELTVVIDRGIFGAETFTKFIDHPHLHLITWDKDYRQDGWKTDHPEHGQFIFERTRNHSRDLKPYHFSHQDQRSHKDPRLRRIIVRATNPKGKTIEVAVLATDDTRPAQEIILLIFRRWVQENDFKYLDKHFGIDQITSYQAVSYKELAKEITDKTMLSTAHRSLTKQRKEETSTLKTLLWKRERAQRREEERKSAITDLEAQLKQQPQDQQTEQSQSTAVAATALLRKQIGSQRGQQKRAAGNNKKWEHKIQTQHEKIEEINRQLKETSAEESRLEQMIEREAVKMKGSRKRLMDALKILARNLFYIMLGPFKADYDNYRDDHVIFRSLTTSGGLIEADERQVTCHILLEPDHPRAIRRYLENYLRDWNENSPQFPDGSRRPVTLKLITAEGLQVALPQSPFRPNH